MSKDFLDEYKKSASRVDQALAASYEEGRLKANRGPFATTSRDDLLSLLSSMQVAIGQELLGDRGVQSYAASGDYEQAVAKVSSILEKVRSMARVTAMIEMRDRALKARR
jgi:hypothetical protein